MSETNARAGMEGFGGWKSVDHFAQIFGRTRETFMRWADAAGLSYRKIGGRRFYRESDVMTWLETGEAPVPPARRRRVRGNGK